MRNEGLTLVEVLVLMVIIGILLMLLFLLPILPHSHAPSRRSACVNNLKQLGLVFNLYASENNGEFPPIDDTKNNFLFNGNVIYPEYLTDAGVLGCPSDPEYDREKSFRLLSNDYHPSCNVGEVHPDCLSDMSYGYVGWMVTTDEETEAFFKAYDEMLPEDRGKDIVVPEGKGNGGGDIIHRLSNDVDRFLLTDTNTIFSGDGTTASIVPVMWDQISTDITQFSHVPAGQNVLYLDGHVEFQRYDKSNTAFPTTPLSAAMFGGRKREPIPDCEE